MASTPSNPIASPVVHPTLPVASNSPIAETSPQVAPSQMSTMCVVAQITLPSKNAKCKISSLTYGVLKKPVLLPKSAWLKVLPTPASRKNANPTHFHATAPKFNNASIINTSISLTALTAIWRAMPANALQNNNPLSN